MLEFRRRAAPAEHVHRNKEVERKFEGEHASGEGRFSR
jgi:hypothetical protein